MSAAAACTIEPGRCPPWNQERAVYEWGQTDTHLIDIIPMLFNHRVVLTPKADLRCYDVGWCYPSLVAAVDALAAWDPATEPEPVGYLKRIGFGDERGAPPGSGIVSDGAATNPAEGETSWT
jgi:hypothetical protein